MNISIAALNPRRNGNGELRGLKQRERERGAVEAIGVSETQKIPVVFFFVGNGEKMTELPSSFTRD